MIYLDHAAATPVCKNALEAMNPFFSDEFFNPSSPYLAAKHVRQKYESAKGDIAHVIGAKSADIVITSGATEATNLAFTVAPKHCLILATEHPSVREVARQYNCDIVKVNKKGIIDLKDLRQKITPETELISVSLANNELGTIQPLAEISELIKKVKQERYQNRNNHNLYLHSDASQALSLIDLNVARLGVDLLTLNSAKIYGPKGVGTLYVAHGVKLKPITYGGGQEMGLRSGTENVPGVVGFAAAAKLAKAHLNGNRKKYANLTKILRDELKKSEIEPLFLGDQKRQLANFCPVSFPGIDAERIIYMLEEQEIYLSTGAACAASKGEKSHVLTAIGLSDAEIAGSLRISLGILNNEENVRLAGQAIVAAIASEKRRQDAYV